MLYFRVLIRLQHADKIRNNKTISCNIHPIKWMHIYINTFNHIMTCIVYLCRKSSYRKWRSKGDAPVCAADGADGRRGLEWAWEGIHIRAEASEMRTCWRKAMETHPVTALACGAKCLQWRRMLTSEWASAHQEMCSSGSFWRCSAGTLFSPLFLGKIKTSRPLTFSCKR